MRVRVLYIFWGKNGMLNAGRQEGSKEKRENQSNTNKLVEKVRIGE